jgi:hypothetical protein
MNGLDKLRKRYLQRTPTGDREAPPTTAEGPWRLNRRAFDGVPKQMMKRPAHKLSPSEELNLFAGLVVQPLVTVIVAFLAFPLLLDSGGRTLAGGFPVDVTDSALSVALGAGVLSLFVTLLGAFPTALWLTKRKQVSLGEALLWGLGFGNAPMILGTVLAGTYGAAGFVRGVAFSSLLGVTGAAVFWAIAIRRQPSR